MTTTRRLTLVWVALVALTLSSFTVGAEHNEALATAATVLVLALAMIKVRLVGVHFMDLRDAPWPLLSVFGEMDQAAC